jgi:hypothetical protein
MSTQSPNPCDVPQLKVGRDVNGRFRPGNQGGPGNPFARKVAALRKTLLDCVSEQDLKDMVEAVKLKARQGDMAAIKLLWQYCVGKADFPKDPDRMDADEWQRLRQMRVSEHEYCATVEDVSACLACHLAEVDWPCELQQGPMAPIVHHARSQLDAGNPSAEPLYGGQIPTQHGAPPDAAPAHPGAAAADPTAKPNAPAEPPAPTAQRPSPARPTSKSDDRREPPDTSGHDSHSLTQPPSPNGKIEQEQSHAPQPAQRPPRPSGQTQRKPPRR